MQNKIRKKKKKKKKRVFKSTYFIIYISTTKVEPYTRGAFMVHLIPVSHSPLLALY